MRRRTTRSWLEQQLPHPSAASCGAFLSRPERAVFTEWEVCSEEGKLFRMDRVVVDKGCVTVIDWKTGAEEDQADQHGSRSPTTRVSSRPSTRGGR